MVHVDLEDFRRLERKVDYLLRLMRLLVVMEVTMTGEIEALTTQVQANTDVEASALILIQGLAAQLSAAGTDPAKLNELKTKLSTSAAALAAAVAANTPAAPPAPTP